jgi:hypothetical protein
MKAKFVYQIFEREDIQKRNLIKQSAEIITTAIKNHFIKTINKYIDISKVTYEKVHEIDQELTFIPYDYFTIVIQEGSTSWAKQDDTEKRFLCLGPIMLLNWKNKIYDHIVNKAQYQLNKDLKKLKEENFYNLIREHIMHELTHKYDDEMKHNLFSWLEKVYHVVEGDREKALNIYMKKYPNLSPEYNAFFITAANEIIDKIENGTKYSDFKSFYKDFKIILKNHGGRYDFFNKTSRFKNHIDKRIYDLWTKLH